MTKSIKEMVKEIAREKLPYEGLSALSEFRSDKPFSSKPLRPTTDENPRHREDFNRLLGATARKPARA